MAGLVLFLWNVNQLVALIVLGIVGLTAICHIATVMLPVFYVDCPFRIPLSPALFKIAWPLRCITLPAVWRPVRNAVSAAMNWVGRGLRILVIGFVYYPLKVVDCIPIIIILAMMSAFGLLALSSGIVFHAFNCCSCGCLWLILQPVRWMGRKCSEMVQDFLRIRFGVKLVVPDYIAAPPTFTDMFRPLIKRAILAVPRPSISFHWPPKIQALEAAELELVNEKADSLDGAAICWLSRAAARVDNRSIAIEAVSGLGVRIQAVKEIIKNPCVLETLADELDNGLNVDTPDSNAKTELVARG
jgi:hypothetical protein